MIAQQQRASPLARRVAAALGVELAGLAGSGPGGRVTKADVVAGVRPTAAPAGQRPVATAMLEADVGAALIGLAARAPALALVGLRAGLLAWALAAAAAVLPAHPLLNARWGEDAIVLRRRLHIAAGAAGADGLRWALVRDAGDHTLRGLARALAAPAGDLGAATFAIVSMEAASWQSAPPLAGTTAALSLGAPQRRAIAVDGSIALRPLAALTLSYDARAIDHAEAARFLVELRARMEQAP